MLRVEDEQARQVPEPALGAQPVDRRRQEGGAEVERADGERGRPEEAARRPCRGAVRGAAPQAREDGGRVAERVGVRVDREHARVRRRPRRRAARAASMSARRACRARIDPPRARGDQPQQVDVQVAVARRAGALRGGDQRCNARRRRAGAVRPVSSIQVTRARSSSPSSSRSTSRSSATTTSRPAELDGELGGGEQAPARPAGSLSSAARRNAVDRDGERAAPPRPRGRRIELDARRPRARR